MTANNDGWYPVAPLTPFELIGLLVAGLAFVPVYLAAVFLLNVREDGSSMFLQVGSVPDFVVLVVLQVRSISMSGFVALVVSCVVVLVLGFASAFAFFRTWVLAGRWGSKMWAAAAGRVGAAARGTRGAR